LNILVIDSHNMLHRARHGYGQGDHIMTFGFFRSLKSEITKHNADKVFIVSEGYPIHRYRLNPEYKGTRISIKDDGFYRQKDDVFKICSYLPITYIRHPDYECDDVIGYICETANKKDNVTIVSTDSDFIQLLELENVKLWNPIKKKFIEKWPVDYVAWKALVGDKADNVPGIKGIGSKRAFKLLGDKDFFGEFLSNNSNKELYDNCYEQIKLANLDGFSLGLEIKNYKFDEEKLKESFTKRSFKSIIEKAWPKWQDTMEKLNNVNSGYTVN